MIPCELDLTSTTFHYTTTLTYEIDLPPSGIKVGFNLLDDEYFTIPYITDTIPNSLADRKLPAQAKRNLWIIAINGKYTITDQGVIDELNSHQNPHGKSKFKISLCSRKSYQRTDLEEIFSIFYQVRPVVPYLKVGLPEKPFTPKKIVDGSKDPKRCVWKKTVFVKYEKNKHVSLLSAPTPIKSLPDGRKFLYSLIGPSIK